MRTKTPDVTVSFGLLLVFVFSARVSYSRFENFIWTDAMPFGGSVLNETVGLNGASL